MSVLSKWGFFFSSGFENYICLGWSVGNGLCLLSWPCFSGVLGLCSHFRKQPLLLVSFHSSEQLVKNHLIAFTLSFFSLGLWERFGHTKKNTKFS